jgi:hypothetical protein
VRDAMGQRTAGLWATGQQTGVLKAGRGGAENGAPLLHFAFDGIADFAGARELVGVAAAQRRGVGKVPVELGPGPRKDGASFGVGVVANSNDVGKIFAEFEDVRDAPGLVAGNVNADFMHGFDDNRIEFARLNAGAVCLELCGAQLIDERCCHLAAGAVVDADKQDFLFHLMDQDSLPRRAANLVSCPRGSQRRS